MNRSDAAGPDEAAVACELTPADHAAQSQRWARLVHGAGISQERTPDGIRLVFRADPAAERELRALAAIESECCSWAQWQVMRGDEAIVLHASASGPGIEALHEMLRADSREP